jgi:hypothetical protein
LSTRCGDGYIRSGRLCRRESGCTSFGGSWPFWEVHRFRAAPQGAAAAARLTAQGTLTVERARVIEVDEQSGRWSHASGYRANKWSSARSTP